MKAVLLEKPYDIKVTDKTVPEPGPEEALIKIKAAGICGSDMGAFRGTNGLVSYPRIIGHELAGEIMKINPDNKKGLKVGDRVVIDPYLYCGHCYPCSLGRTNCCEDLKVLGVHVDGGMAEYFVHPSEMLVKAPDNVKWDLLPIAEPLTIALHGIHRLAVKKGESVVIFGAGAIGLLAALVSVVYGAKPVLVDVVQARLDFAKKLGIENIVNSSSENVKDAVLKINGGELAHCVMEASGSNAAIRSSLDVVRNAGRVAFTGWPKGETSIPTDIITKKEIDLRGARTSAGEFEEALELIASKKIDVEKVLTKVISIDDVPDVMKDMDVNPGNYLKVNVVF